MNISVILLCCLLVVACGEPQCTAPHCQLVLMSHGRGQYLVEGHKIRFGYYDNSYQSFFLDCSGWQALDSAATPRFLQRRSTAAVILTGCPLPAGRSLAAVLASYNVTAEPNEEGLIVSLKHAPAEPPLTADHLRGLEAVTVLSVQAADGQELQPAPGLLSRLRGLQYFTLSGVKLPLTELTSLPNPRIWRTFSKQGRNLGPLHEVISKIVLALPEIKNLTVTEVADDEGDTEEVTIAVTESFSSSAPYSTLSVRRWTERELAPLEHCGDIEEVNIQDLRAEAVPARWLAACRRLRQLAVLRAETLARLTPGALAGTPRLKHLTLANSKITFIPSGFFDDNHNLVYIDFTNSRIGSLDSEVFRGPRAELRFINLRQSSLDNTSLAAFSGLSSLETLILADTKIRGNICTDDDFAEIRRLPQLRRVDLEGTAVSGCTAWRPLFASARLAEIYPLTSSVL